MTTKITDLLSESERLIKLTPDVINFIEHPEKWSMPQRTPGYGILCAQFKKSGRVHKHKFIANIVKLHPELGKLLIAVGKPVIYPGHRKIYFPIRYVTEDRRLFREIVIFPTSGEPQQDDVNRFYTAALLCLLLSPENIKCEQGWNSSYLLRPLFELLAQAVLERQLNERRNNFKNLIYNSDEHNSLQSNPTESH